MSTAMRLAGYGLGLALVFGVAWQLGTLTGAPAWPAVGWTGPVPAQAPRAAAADPGQPGQPAPGTDTAGLAATAAGYTLVPEPFTFLPGKPGELAFAITGSDGRPVRAFDLVDTQPMQAIVVRRDAAGFQHLQPALGPDGRWRTPLTLPAGGSYRLYADFTPTGGPSLVLGTDLVAAGDFQPIGFAPARVAQLGDYQVRLDGDLVAGGPSQIFATVSRNGVAVGDLQPHLGAFGHLVALRRSDLAYRNVPADAGAASESDRSGPGIAFTATVPSPGSYRLFLEFRHDGVVRTAEFTVDTRDGA